VSQAFIKPEFSVGLGLLLNLRREGAIAVVNQTKAGSRACGILFT